jgi:hypothetical protein
VLLTTGKDVLNLSEESAGLIAPFPLYWLQASVEMEREEAFLRLIEAGLNSISAWR